MDEETGKKIIQQYPKAIVNLRKQLDLKRLGLLFGAGVSKPYGLPNWDDLVRLIGDQLSTAGISVSTKPSGSVAYQTQLLFQHYYNHRLSTPDGKDERQLKADISRGWRDLLHSALYKTAFAPPYKALDEH